MITVFTVNVGNISGEYIVKNYPCELCESCVSIDFDCCFDEFNSFADTSNPSILSTTSSSLPSSFDWRDATFDENGNIEPGNGNGYDFMTPVEYQGQCGSCWAFASIGALEAVYKIMFKHPPLSVKFSEQYMVSCANWGYGCFGCDGAWSWTKNLNFLKWLVTNDAIPDSCFPYQSGDGQVPPCEDKCADFEDKKISVENYGWISWGGDASIDYIKQNLISRGPLVARMDVYDDFKGSNYPDKSKWPDDVYAQTSNSDTSGHLVVIVGYNDDPGYWICKNSWGRWWGLNGYFKIGYGECEIENKVAYLEVEDISARVFTLYVIDDLIFEDVTPGDTVAGSFTIRNSGSHWESLLDWEIIETPDWGTWEFNPNSGEGLKRGWDYVHEVTFSVEAPRIENTEFTGQIKVQNLNSYFDYEYIDVSLSTTKFPVSNLSCFDSTLRWNSAVAPGSQLKGSFKVINIGDKNSKLNWEVISYPSEMVTISPLSGDNLRPDDPPVEVQVTIDVPDEKLKTFGGIILVQNKDDSENTHAVAFTFYTAKEYFLSNIFRRFLSIFEYFRYTYNKNTNIIYNYIYLKDIHMS